MRLSSLLATAATLSLVALPALAAPVAPVNPAAGLSLTGGGDVRAGAPMKRSNKAAQTSTLIIAGVAVAAVVGVAVALSSHHDSKAASS